jgi:hypothetical protein
MIYIGIIGYIGSRNSLKGAILSQFLDPFIADYAYIDHTTLPEPVSKQVKRAILRAGWPWDPPASPAPSPIRADQPLRASRPASLSGPAGLRSHSR